METFEEDRKEILTLAGLQYRKSKSNSHQEVQSTNLTTVELTKNYFIKLPKDVTANLTELYKYDFQLFDYDPHLYSQSQG